MKVNVTAPVLNYEGKALEDGDKEPLSYRQFISAAMNNFLQDEKPLAEDKAKAFNISSKLWAGKEVDFTAGEIVYIIERSGILHEPLVYGRICELFNESPKK